MLKAKEEILKRLNARTEITSDNHWLWIGSKSKSGYGKIRFYSRDLRVNRLSASIHLGLDLDDPLQLALHKNSCRHRNCWNPNCLYVGTDQDNHDDTAALKTHCKDGHELTKDNIYMQLDKNGKRYRKCKTCEVQRMRDKRASVW